MPRLSYVASLDGLRALSALAVVLLHTHVPHAMMGGLGVDIFFVLSGFLITRILLEQMQGGGVDIADFYARRCRRLMPALCFMILVSLGAAWLFAPELPLTGFSALFAATYTMDIADVLGFPMTIFSHCWSLAAEMQFYLLWPFALPWLLRFPSPRLVLLLGWAVMLTIMAAGLTTDTDAAVFRPFHAAGILMGGIVALSPALAVRWTWPAVIMIGLSVLPGTGQSYVAQVALAQGGAALLVGSLGQGGAVDRALSLRPLVFLGKISYGVYLWHFPIAMIMGPAPWQMLLMVALGGSVMMGTMSYLVIEPAGRRFDFAAAIRRARGVFELA